MTIGSVNDMVLSAWEPGAPLIHERVMALQYARTEGFQTSVSMEPMLDANPDAVIVAVRPYVTGRIWLGRANKLSMRVRMNTAHEVPAMQCKALAIAAELDAIWTDEAVAALYYRLSLLYPQIAWKDSIRKVVGP